MKIYTTTEAKERPVVFDRMELHSALRGEKNVLRIPVEWSRPDKKLDFSSTTLNPEFDCPCSESTGWVLSSTTKEGKRRKRTRPTFCPLGRKGDLLWVQEDFWADKRDSSAILYKDDPKLGKARGCREARPAVFDGKNVTMERAMQELAKSTFWKPAPASRMESWSSRLTLEITGVKIERLSRINDHEIAAEGYNWLDFGRMLEEKALCPKALHWVGGWEESIPYCHPCCKKKVEELKKDPKTKDPENIDVDGGWGQDEDGFRFCEGCGVAMDYNLTDYGVKSAVEGFEGSDMIQSPLDYYEASRMFQNDDQYYPDIRERLRRLGFRLWWNLRFGKSHPWAKDPWVWRIGVKRAS